MNPAQLTVLRAFMNMQSDSTVNGGLKTDGENLYLNDNLIACHHHSGTIRLNSPFPITESYLDKIDEIIEFWNNMQSDITVIRYRENFLINGLSWSGVGWGHTNIRSQYPTQEIVSSRTQLMFSPFDDAAIIAFTRKQSLNQLGSNFRTDGDFLWFKDNGIESLIAGHHIGGYINICCGYPLSMDVYDLHREKIVLIMEAWNRLHRNFTINRNNSLFFSNNTDAWDGTGWLNTEIYTYPNTESYPTVSSRTQENVLSVGEMNVVDAFINRQSREDGDGWNYRLKTDGDWLWLNGNVIAAHSDAEGVTVARQRPPYIWLKCRYSLQNDMDFEELHHTVLIWNNMNAGLRVTIDGLYFVINGNAWSGDEWTSSRIRSKQRTVNVSSRTQEVVNAFLQNRVMSGEPLNTDGHKMRYAGSTIAKTEGGRIFIRIGITDYEEKIKVLLMIPGIDSIVRENTFGYRVNGMRWTNEWFEVGLHSRLVTNKTDFDVTSIWMDKLKYNKPKFAVAETTIKESLGSIKSILNESNIEFKSMVSDTYGKYEPHYFLIVKPQFFEEAKQLLINKQQEL